MEVRIKRLSEKAIMPTKAHSDDAGWDLYASGVMYDVYGNLWYSTGIAMEIPKGYVGLIFPRSSISKKELLLTNSVGVIDSGYRGEISFKFVDVKKIDHEAYTEESYYNVGDRIGQIIIMPYPEIEFVEVDELSETERGTGGYGSSGK